MISTLLFLVIGIAAVIKGADWLVSGASSVAKRWGVSDLVIGLTIVAFGTSAPELIVSVLASWRGEVDIAIGNILGSNIANILLILGLAAMVYPLRVQSATVWKEIPLSLLAIIALAVMVNDTVFDGASISVLGRGDGIDLILFFLIFMYYTFGLARSTSKSNGNQSDAQDAAEKVLSTGLAMIFIVLGLALLALGGHMIVGSAVAIASAWGVSQALIGLTIVAVGTSLPELATSIVAALKKKADIAVGNVVGSNIFNIFWILGVSAIISPLPFNTAANFDVLMVMLATFLLFACMFVGRRHQLERWQGATMVALYCAYLAYIVFRG